MIKLSKYNFPILVLTNLFLFIAYEIINTIYYKHILIDIHVLFFLIIIINICIYSKNREIYQNKLFLFINFLFIAVILGVIIMNIPKYTYNRASDMMIKKFGDQVYTMKEDFYGNSDEISSKTIQVKYSPYFLSDKEYRFYVQEKGKLEMYIFDAYKGNIIHSKIKK